MDNLNDNISIDTLLSILRKLTLEVENNDYSNEKLLIIERYYKKLIEHIELFLLSNYSSYYGYMMISLKVEATFTEKIIAGIRLNSYPFVFLANPLIICKFSIQEIIYIVCHEIDHIVYNHPSEALRLNPSNRDDIAYKFNIAADAAVNDGLKQEIDKDNLNFIKIPLNIIFSHTLATIFSLKNVKPNENYLYYYNLIKDKKNKLNNKKVATSRDVISDSSLDTNYNLYNKKENNQSCVESDNVENVVTIYSNKEYIDHHWTNMATDEEVKELIKKLLNDTVEIYDKSRGNLPSNLLETIEELNKKPKIKWESLLKKYVGTIPFGSRSTRQRLNRRQPERFDLSGRITSTILKIVVAIDTSGSMSHDDILEVFDEIFGILSKKKFEITVIECDSEIERIYKAKNKSQIMKSVIGRGGTFFTPVIEYLNKNKYYRDAILIYFTDGYGESEIPKPLTYRNMWVLIKSSYLSLREPYGIVVERDENESIILD